MAIIKKDKVVEVVPTVDFLGITSDDVLDWIPESTSSKHKDKVLNPENLNLVKDDLNIRKLSIDS
eukprot:7673801-Heterocapsa_arctica.AAC.1